MSCMQPSQVKISGVSYKNIKGTSTSLEAVSIVCSSAVPCEGIEMTDIDLQFVGTSSKSTSISALCSNTKITYGGQRNPPACDL